MTRDVTADHRARSCSICGRHLLVGESAERYLSREGKAFWVCSLCPSKALARGFTRAPVERASQSDERLHAGSPRRVAPERGAGAQAHTFGEQNGGDAFAVSRRGSENSVHGHVEPKRSFGEAAAVTEDPYAADVSSSEAARVRQAVGVFNESAHRGMVLGIARTLGRPWASAACVSGHPGQVAIAVAWELSWYEFRVDIDGRMVALVGRGDKLSQLDESLREWNLISDAQGRLNADQWHPQ